MKEYKLPTNKNFLLSLSVTAFVLMIFSTYLKITDGNYAQNNADLIIAIAMFFHIILWFVIIIDMIRNQIKNKTMWIVGMFMFSSITLITYLITRENHLQTDRKFKSI